jgi:hypothetical protein
MGIYSSTNPTDWGQLDGVYIDETSPPPSVTGVPANTAILVGQFERGSPVIQSVGSAGQLFELYGNNIAFAGNIALQNKKFGLLKVVRVVAASGAVAATHTFTKTGPANVIAFTALWTGAYGNNITVTIAAGSTAGSKYTVHDGNPNAVWPDEVYDNVLIAAVGQTFANSNLITATVLSSSAEPSTITATALSTGSDGSVADADYQTAIQAQCQGTNVGNILFLDAYNTTRNGYLKASMAATTDKMAIVCGQNGDSVATAVTDVANDRDTDGRLIYAFPYVFTTISGVSTAVNPASFYASLLSQIAPNIDPAFAGNSQYCSGIDSLNANLQRSDYIALAAAGISAFEVDSDIGVKIKSGVVTQIANSSKIMVFRRRMTDYICQSLAKFLKNYQNAPNSLENRTKVNASISAFNRLLESVALVPKDSEVQSGKASIIDTTSLNTDDSIAAGYFKILYKRRIYSSMRFIVLQASIGEGVVVTEAG